MVSGPDDTQRTIILGRTGSGKTVFSCNLLASRSFDTMPWVIIDYKGDSLIEAICKQNRIKEITPYQKPPKKPGLYIMKPRPHLDDMALENWLMKVWAQEDIGLYIDEGYALPQKAAFDMILTQGRSKHIPVIALYQRPVYMSRFAVAQADFFGIFEQNDERDLKTTKSFVKPFRGPNGEEITVYEELPPYYCMWYDVGHGETSILKPCPGRNTILAEFRDRLQRRTSSAHRLDRWGNPIGAIV